MTETRLLLCRPVSGLSDILSQIEKACLYGEKFGRLVIVDTNCQSTPFFKDDFSNYFVSRQPHLRLNTHGFQELFDRLDAVPDFLSGRVTTYAARFDAVLVAHVDDRTGRRLTFDFGRDYPQPLLVHHAGGHQESFLAALTRMHLRERIVDVLIDRIKAIGTPYTGVHIRHTDYQTEYVSGIEILKSRIEGPVFLATDNRAVLEHARQSLGRERVYSFANLPAEPGKTAHFFADGEAVYERNVDAIVDLLMLALSRTFYFFTLLENRFGSRFSAYSVLADQLRNSPHILRQLISRPDDAIDRLISLRFQKP